MRLMEFRVLGPVEIWDGGIRIDAGHVKQRSVLAVLLLDLGRVVSIDLLIDRVWGDWPPASVRNNLYAYVARLRRIIADAESKDVNLTRRSGGYQLEADPDRVDLYRFRRLLAEAASGAARAGEPLGEALRLWRGPALAGLSSPWLSGMRDTLELQRIEALLDLGDVALREGHHAALCGTLAGEAVTHPADERLIGQLMLALYRSGRQAEALRWFERTRRHLAEELGADPGSGLARLHQQILRSDLALGQPDPASAAARPTSIRPSRGPGKAHRAIVAAATLATGLTLVAVGLILGISLTASGESPVTSPAVTIAAPRLPAVTTGPTCSSTSLVQGTPVVCVSQARGDPSTAFALGIEGFRPGTKVSLILIYYPPPPSPTGPPPRPRTLRTLKVAGNGSVPLGTFQLGLYMVVATAPASGGGPASSRGSAGSRLIAVFQVLPPGAR